MRPGSLATCRFASPTRASWCSSASPGRASRRGRPSGSPRRRSCRPTTCAAVVGHHRHDMRASKDANDVLELIVSQAAPAGPAHGHRLHRPRAESASPLPGVGDEGGGAVPRHRRRHARTRDPCPQPRPAGGRAVGGRHEPAAVAGGQRRGARRGLRRRPSGVGRRRHRRARPALRLAGRGPAPAGGSHATALRPSDRRLVVARRRRRACPPPRRHRQRGRGGRLLVAVGDGPLRADPGRRPGVGGHPREHGHARLPRRRHEHRCAWAPSSTVSPTATSATSPRSSRPSTCCPAGGRSAGSALPGTSASTSCTAGSSRRSPSATPASRTPSNCCR